MKFEISDEDTIAVIGLGYVGLPLAIEFAKNRRIIGLDTNENRIRQLQSGSDHTRQVSDTELNEATFLSLTSQFDDVALCKVFIITVPTPINHHKQPDLKALKNASRSVAKIMQRGCVVIYESTVYPGATEEICVPILESNSGLTFNSDFFAAYSPERVNPGDREHRLTTIPKVTSGSTSAVAYAVDALYSSIITAGTHPTSSIKVAEAAKVIENTQRDVNIALVNELAMIFDKLDIDTLEVLEAARTKWNFLDFRPGLVGGHCISVDPYYLAHKAQEIGHHPQVILSGRQINDGMGAFIAERVVRMLSHKRIHVVGANILVLGLAFKENCPDLRNTQVVDMIGKLQFYHASVDVHDPWIDEQDAMQEYGITPIAHLQTNHYDAVILAVAHQQFIDWGSEYIRSLGKPVHILYDIKSVLGQESVDARL